MDVDAFNRKEVEESEEGQDQEPSRKKDLPEWRKYQNMSVEEKRKYYKCGRYVQIKDIETWSEFYPNNGYMFSKIQKNTKNEKPVCSVDANINDKISLWEGDITTLEIDAIVNAANSSLLGGGGVDGCIHRAAGKTLVEECRLLNGCDTGDAKITSGHKLPAKYVIHTVGPIGKDEKALENCYKNCLRLALKNEVRTLAFCCVSTGIYGYPNSDAAEVALRTTREWLEVESNAEAVDRIIFCLFLQKDIDIYHKLMLKYFPPVELKKPTQKSDDKAAKTPAKSKNEEAKRKKEPEKKDTKTKHRGDTKKSDDKNLGGEPDTEKDDEEMKTERKTEKVDGKVTDTLAEDKEDKGLLREKEVGRSDKKGEEMKKVEEMQKGRKDVGSGEDERSSIAGGRNKEKKNIAEETKKDEKMQMGNKVKDNESANVKIPVPKKQKKEDIMDVNTEKRGLQDVEMTEKQPQAQQEQKTEGQGEKMDVADPAGPQQEKENDEKMEAKDETMETSQQDVVKESPESPLKEQKTENEQDEETDVGDLPQQETENDEEMGAENQTTETSQQNVISEKALKVL